MNENPMIENNLICFFNPTKSNTRTDKAMIIIENSGKKYGILERLYIVITLPFALYQLKNLLKN